MQTETEELYNKINNFYCLNLNAAIKYIYFEVTAR